MSTDDGQLSDEMAKYLTYSVQLKNIIDRIDDHNDSMDSNFRELQAHFTNYVLTYNPEKLRAHAKAYYAEQSTGAAAGNEKNKKAKRDRQATDKAYAHANYMATMMSNNQWDATHDTWMKEHDRILKHQLKQLSPDLYKAVQRFVEELMSTNKKHSIYVPHVLKEISRDQARSQEVAEDKNTVSVNEIDAKAPSRTNMSGEAVAGAPTVDGRKTVPQKNATELVLPLTETKNTVPVNKIGRIRKKTGQWSYTSKTGKSMRGSWSFNVTKIAYGAYHYTDDNAAFTLDLGPESRSPPVLGKVYLCGLSDDRLEQIQIDEQRSLQPYLKHLAQTLYDDSDSNTIRVHSSSIREEIQRESESDRAQVFVLPSQLNSAEYPSHTNIVENASKYTEDRTGGPIGQLSVNWGVADFIIKNAANNNRKDGLNNIRLMGDIVGIKLVNGYLKVEDDTVDLTKFRKQLPKMTVMAVHNIPVNKAIGMDDEPLQFEMNKKVSLVYASAVPVEVYTNLGMESIRVKAVAFMTLVGQYTAALRAAIDKGNCDAYLMLLGGGYFNNSPTSIKAAIGFAVDTLRSELIKAEVNVFVLVYSGNDEINKFRKTPAAERAAVPASESTAVPASESTAESAAESTAESAAESTAVPMGSAIPLSVVRAVAEASGRASEASATVSKYAKHAKNTLPYINKLDRLIEKLNQELNEADGDARVPRRERARRIRINPKRIRDLTAERQSMTTGLEDINNILEIHKLIITAERSRVENYLKDLKDLGQLEDDKTTRAMVDVAKSLRYAERDAYKTVSNIGALTPQLQQSNAAFDHYGLGGNGGLRQMARATAKKKKKAAVTAVKKAAVQKKKKAAAAATAVKKKKKTAVQKKKKAAAAATAVKKKKTAAVKKKKAAVKKKKKTAVKKKKKAAVKKKKKKK